MTPQLIRRTMILAVLFAPLATMADRDNSIPTKHNEATVAQLKQQMASGRLSSEQLTREYIARIIALDQSGPGVNSVIELNPDATRHGAQCGCPAHGTARVLGPLHGIPVLLKGNIDTGDQMQTDAGSFALMRRAGGA